MATVGVVSERIRLEEKQLLAAFAGVGLEPSPFPPGALPLALTPGGQALPQIMVDRYQNRAAAVAIMTACRAGGAITVDAGLAARADRLAVAAALAMAGLPRPETRLALSAEAALAALKQFGYPGTVLPVAVGGKAISLLDVDTAEAVLEHRDVLGSSHDALSLVQAGAPIARWSVMVVGGAAVASAASSTLEPLPDAARGVAETAAAVLGAAVIAIEIARLDTGLVIWDVNAVPEFRQAAAIGPRSVASAVAELAQAHAAGLIVSEPAPDVISLESTHRREVGHGVVLTA